MRSVAEKAFLRTTLAEAWDTYFDPDRWPSWVDGFDETESLSEPYPEVGGTVVWRSLPGGRGTVSERVVEHEPRRLHRASYEDDSTTGELTTTFALEGEGVEVNQSLSYELKQRTPFIWLTDLLFIRREMQRSLARSLTRLRAEVEERVDD